MKINFLFLAQQQTGAGGGSAPIAGGAIHPTSSLNSGAGSVPHGVGASGIGHHSSTATNHLSSLLWTKTQQLPEELFRQVCVQASNLLLINLLHSLKCANIAYRKWCEFFVSLSSKLFMVTIFR